MSEQHVSWPLFWSTDLRCDEHAVHSRGGDGPVKNLDISAKLAEVVPADVREVGRGNEVDEYVLEPLEILCNDGRALLLLLALPHKFGCLPIAQVRLHHETQAPGRVHLPSSEKTFGPIERRFDICINEGGETEYGDGLFPHLGLEKWLLR